MTCGSRLAASVYRRRYVPAPAASERASSVPSAARIVPRFTRSSSMSARRFLGLSRSACASKTDQRLVNATSAAKSTQHDDEQAGDRRVHRGSLTSRRARSETSSSSASRMKFATIDDPP